MKPLYSNRCRACCKWYRQSVNEYQTASETKYASAESSAREWAEVTARANMHKGKWSEYWEEAKAAGDMGNEKVSLVLSSSRHKECITEEHRCCTDASLMLLASFGQWPNATW